LETDEKRERALCRLVYTPLMGQRRAVSQAEAARLRGIPAD